MSRREEFVGVRVIDHMTSEGPCYSQWLTDEPIVRCRDCERYLWRGHLGRSYCNGEYATDPDDFCSRGREEGWQVSEPTYKTKLLVMLHNGGFTLYSTEPPERVREQLGGTCLWVKDIDGADVQLNLREVPMIGVMPNE